MDIDKALKMVAEGYTLEEIGEALGVRARDLGAALKYGHTEAYESARLEYKKRIKELVQKRNRDGETQKSIAQSFGVSRATIHNYLTRV